MIGRFAATRGLLAVVMLVWVCPALAVMPTSAPGDQVDQNTREILKELDASKSMAPAATEPGAPAEAAGPNWSQEESGEAAIQWGRLIRDFRYMLATAGALGVAGGVVGFFVLLRREALVALAIPQVVAVGAALGMRYSWPTLPPALGVAIVALVYFALSKRWGARDWVVPSFYIAGLCLSFLLIANHGQDVEDLQHLFVGFDVAVRPEQAMLAVPILVVVGGVCAMLWRRWLLLAQAPAAAELAGLRPARWDTLFLSLLTIVLLLGTNSLGVVMVLTMLFLPAAAVLPWARRIPVALLASALLSLLYLAVGFYLSNRMVWPLSQSVGGAGFAVLVISHLIAQFR